MTNVNLKNYVQNNSHYACELDVDMIKLEVIQGEIARLLEKMDEIELKGWYKEPGASELVFHEILDKVRLIDMAFYPLFEKMQQDTKELNDTASILHDMVVKKRKSRCW